MSEQKVPDSTEAQAEQKQSTVLHEAEAGGECTPGARGCPMPKVDFSTFVLSMASSALVHLGEVPNPETGQTVDMPELAKHTIDVLDMLHDKTANGLQDDEKRLLEGLLYELKMKYVIKK